MMSWWVGKSRDEFNAAAPAEQVRMAYAGNRPITDGEIVPLEVQEARDKLKYVNCLQSVIWRRALAWPHNEED